MYYNWRGRVYYYYTVCSSGSYRHNTQYCRILVVAHDVMLTRTLLQQCCCCCGRMGSNKLIMLGLDSLWKVLNPSYAISY